MSFEGCQPVPQALGNAAKRALNIRMFLFTEPTLLHAVIAAHQRGVNVRVMLNPARRNGISFFPGIGSIPAKNRDTNTPTSTNKDTAKLTGYQQKRANGRAGQRCDLGLSLLKKMNVGE